MKTIELILTDTDMKRINRIRQLRRTPTYTPNDEEIIRTAIITYWVAAERADEEWEKDQEIFSTGLTRNRKS